MALQLRWSKRALRRLDEIARHIAKDNPDAASRVVNRLVRAVDNLCLFPDMGRVGRVSKTRELVLADIPYIIPYRVTQKTVEIITVFHASQKPIKFE